MIQVGRAGQGPSPGAGPSSRYICHRGCMAARSGAMHPGPPSKGRHSCHPIPRPNPRFGLTAPRHRVPQCGRMIKILTPDCRALNRFPCLRASFPVNRAARRPSATALFVSCRSARCRQPIRRPAILRHHPIESAPPPEQRSRVHRSLVALCLAVRVPVLS
jgi:hypothetical protein